MRKAIYILVLIVFLVLQVILPPSFLFFGKPDLLLILTVITGLLWGTKAGAGLGLAAGLMQDLFMGGIPGIYTLTKLINGVLAGLVEGNIFKERVLLPALLVFISTFIHEILVIILSENLIFNANILLASRDLILPLALVNGLVGIIIYYLFIKLDRPEGSYYG